MGHKCMVEDFNVWEDPKGDKAPQERLPRFPNINCNDGRWEGSENCCEAINKMINALNSGRTFSIIAAAWAIVSECTGGGPAS